MFGIIKKNNIMTIEEFESLTSKGQWRWIIENKENVKIEVHGELTSIKADCFKRSHLPFVITKSHLTDEDGIKDLLDVLEIKNEVRLDINGD